MHEIFQDRQGFLEFSGRSQRHRAQALSGLLLPIIAVLLLMMVNQTELMRHYRNRKLTNVLGVFVILITTLIAVRQLYFVGQQVIKMF